MSDEVVTEFKLRWYDSQRAGRLAIVTMDNGEDYRRPNTFGPGALRSLHETMDEVERADDCRGLLLTGKQFIFAAGADLDQFEGISAELGREGGRAGHEAFMRLHDLEVPTVAAVNGVALGGGLEIALHCDYRTLSGSAAPVAFPEVFLSILPGWGGTQLTPRLVPVDTALELIVLNPLANNKMLTRAERAFATGLFDELIEPVDFLPASVDRLERIVAGELAVPERRPDHGDLDGALDRARQAAWDRFHGATPAPDVAIDLVEHAARGGDLREGLEMEEQRLGELISARHAQASVYSFDLVQNRVKRQPGKPDVPPRDVRRVAVIGSGLMGAQLGALMLQRLEVPLVMKDIDQQVLDQARAHIEGELDAKVQRGRLDEGKARFLKSVVTYTLDDADLAGCDFLIEAVLEDLDLKKRIFAAAEQHLDPAAVLATNTSSLSVGRMAEDLSHPERVVGFHFFNPVAAMPLVELVRAPATSDEAMATAFELAKRFRKSAVECADAPAFVVNRILTRFMGACGGAVNEGTDFATVDLAAKKLGLPMGPFELLGLVGLPVAAHVARIMHDAFPDRFPLDENFQMLGDSGLPAVYDEAGEVHAEIRQRWQADGDGLDEEAIQRRALEAVAEEVKIMLDEGVVADARDIDTCMLLGAGWPFFMGGICKFLDQTGMSDELFGEQLVGASDRGLPQG